MRLLDAPPREWRISDLPEDDGGHRYEIVDGSLYVTPLADVAHQLLVMDWATRLTSCVPSGLRVLQGVNVIVGDTTMVIPDVAVVDMDHLVMDGLGVSPQGLHLVVEVTSFSTRRRDLTLKRDLYEEWGVPYLLVDRKASPPMLRVMSTLPTWAFPLMDE